MTEAEKRMLKLAIAYSVVKRGAILPDWIKEDQK